MDTNGIRRSFLASCCAAAVAAGCTAPPTKVEGLQAEQMGEKVLVWWRNPINFDRVSVAAADLEAGGEDGLVPGGPEPASRQGTGTAVFTVKEPGTYRIRATSTVGGRAETAEKDLVVEEPIQGLPDREDLGLGLAAEPLDVVFIVKPRAEAADREAPDAAKPAPGGKGSPPFDRRDLFRRMAAAALAETFRTAVEIRDEEELEKLESAREVLARSRLEGQGPLLRLVDPAACVVVELAPGAGDGGPDGIPAQIGLRILDMKLGQELGKRTGEPDRKAGARPLIAEGYQEVGPFEGRREMFIRLRSAWKGLIAETVGSARYRQYRDAMARATRSAEELESLRAAYFADLPPSWKPLPARGEAFEKRVERISREILFEPDPPSPAPGERAPAPEPPAAASGDGAEPEAAPEARTSPATFEPPPPPVEDGESAVPAGTAGRP
jgi:hypothetical protein